MATSGSFIPEVDEEKKMMYVERGDGVLAEVGDKEGSYAEDDYDEDIADDIEDESELYWPAADEDGEEEDGVCYEDALIRSQIGAEGESNFFLTCQHVIEK